MNFYYIFQKSIFLVYLERDRYNNNINNSSYIFRPIPPPQFKDQFFLNNVPVVPPFQRNLQGLNNNNIIPEKPIINKQRYDAYQGFLEDYGLVDEGCNKRRYKTTYLNIDSSFRNKKQKFIFQES